MTKCILHVKLSGGTLPLWKALFHFVYVWFFSLVSDLKRPEMTFEC